MKQLVNKTAYTDPWMFETTLEKLATHVAKLTETHGKDAKLSISGDDVEFYINTRREETDEEYEQRIKRQAAVNKSAEANERAKLAELLKKYGNA